jgi:hypothetical protein
MSCKKWIDFIPVSAHSPPRKKWAEANMSQQSIEAMVERWMGDEGFRHALKADPVGTAEREGYNLSDEEKAALADMDLNQSDAELRSRLSFA